MVRKRTIIICLVISALLTGLVGCGTNSKTTKPKTHPTPNSQASEVPVPVKEQPLAPEKNPVGDIPDTQVFVKYASPEGGYELRVPEGWARTTVGADVTFVDKSDGVQVSITKANGSPTLASVQKEQVPALLKTGKAVEVKAVRKVQTASGPAILIVYNSNSEPDQVTGKKVRLENNSFLYYKDGKLATLRLWAPLGADNVDQWRLMSNSFRWR